MSSALKWLTGKEREREREKERQREKKEEWKPTWLPKVSSAFMSVTWKTRRRADTWRGSTSKQRSRLEWRMKWKMWLRLWNLISFFLPLLISNVFYNIMGSYPAAVHLSVCPPRWNHHNINVKPVFNRSQRRVSGIITLYTSSSFPRISQKDIVTSQEIPWEGLQCDIFLPLWGAWRWLNRCTAV